MAERRARRIVSPERIARVAALLQELGVLGGVRLETDGSAVLLTGAEPVVLSVADPVEDELAAWRARRDGERGSARRP